MIPAKSIYMFNENTRINLEKEKTMPFRIDVKSLIIGLLVGLVAVFVLGAASSRNEGVYQLSMTSDKGSIIYGRMHTGTGRIETWSHSLNNRKAITYPGDNPRMLLRPDSGK